MHYWDSSSLVPLCVSEPSSGVLRNLAGGTSVVTWGGSLVEIASAIERRSREGVLTADQRLEAHRNLRSLAAAWTEITALAPVRERALRLLATHSLRASDAMQLAAALVATSDRPQGHHFICGDRRLLDAATREGFTPATP